MRRGIAIIVILCCIVPLGFYATRLNQENARLRRACHDLTERLQSLETETVLTQPPEPQPASNTDEHHELLRLRGEVARLKMLQIPISQGAPTTDSLALPYRYLSKSLFRNAGKATPAQAIETFLWAATTQNGEALREVSAADGNGQPIPLTGVPEDWLFNLEGVQTVSLTTPDQNDPDSKLACMIAETKIPGQNEINHSVLKLRFRKIDGEWRFAGMVK